MNNVFILVWANTFAVEEEFDLDQITFDNGYFVIDGQRYYVKVLGDSENKPIKLIKQWEDGYPRIVCDWRGMENYFMLDDVVLIPYRVKDVEKDNNKCINCKCGNTRSCCK